MIASKTNLHKRKIAHTFTAIAHRKGFINKQSPYCIVIYKRSGIDKCKTIQTRKTTA